MTMRKMPYDVIVVGGGPSALAEVLRLEASNCHAAVVSDAFGGCLGMMGDLKLQSYIPELEIKNAPRSLTDFMQSNVSTAPSGREYRNYISACFELIKSEKIYCRVQSIEKADGVFWLDGYKDGVRTTLHAKKVVLATGIRPKPPRFQIPQSLLFSCFETYSRITTNDLGCFEGKHVCIVGSGNSAYQLAHALARKAEGITILATKYLGFYPLECDDRFVLRGASFQTIELIEKSIMHENHQGDLNPGVSALAPIYLHVHDELRVDEASGSLLARIPIRSNVNKLLRGSLEAAIRRGLVRSSEGETCLWSRELSGLVVVCAIGVEANTVRLLGGEGNIDGDGYYLHDSGQMKIDGMYVAGSAAGYKSVNLMQRVGAQLL